MQADPDIFATITAPGYTNQGLPIVKEQVMGAITYSNSVVIGAEALQYALATEVAGNSGSKSRAKNKEWTLQAVNNVRAYSCAYANVNPWSASAQQDVSGSNIRGDLVKFFSGFVLLFIYCILVLSSSSWIHSRTLLALSSLIAICLAIIASYGVASLIGQKWNQVVNILPFLLLGLGVDDTFVITDMVKKTKAPLGVEDVMSILYTRIPRSIARAGASILVTSLTDMVAFFAGSYTDTEGLRTFCIFAGFGILFDFIFQITFFLGWLVLDVRRSTKNNLDWCCCIGERQPPVPCCSCPCFKPTQPFEEDEGRPIRFFITRLARIMLTIPGKVIVLTLFGGLLGVGIYGATKLQTEFSSRWFVPTDSWIQDTFAVQDKYFSGGSPYAAAYTKTGDYASATVQADMWNMGEALRTNAYAQSSTVNSWSDCFVAWTICNKGVTGTCPATSSCAVTATSIVPTASYYTYLNEWLQTSTGDAYADHIQFTDSTNTSIKATRVPFAMVGSVTTDSNIAVAAMNSLRSAVDPYTSVSALAYSYVFLFYEGFTVIKTETIRNLIIAGCCVFLVLLLLLANFLAALYVLAMVAAIDANILGFMYWIGLSFNSVTTICLLLAVGISVDYSVHICHAYLVSHGTRQERALKALSDLGGSVLNGGITTFLAILPLAFSNSYVFDVFFKMFALIIGFGLFHGLLVLPVILSLIGPASTPFPEGIYEDDDATQKLEMSDAPVSPYTGYPPATPSYFYPSM